MHMKNVNVTQEAASSEKNILAAQRQQDIENQQHHEVELDHQLQQQQHQHQSLPPKVQHQQSQQNQPSTHQTLPTNSVAYQQQQQQQQQRHQLQQLRPQPLTMNSSYQAPPLPPRKGGRNPPVGGEDQSTDGLCYAPYKPVPPPKPFPQTASNTHVAGPLSDSADPPEPHILVTDEGSFHTHSAKFPIEPPQQARFNISSSNNLPNINNNTSVIPCTHDNHTNRTSFNHISIQGANPSYIRQMSTSNPALSNLHTQHTDHASTQPCSSHPTGSTQRGESRSQRLGRPGHICPQPGLPLSGSATLGRSVRWMFDSPIKPLHSTNSKSAEELVKNSSLSSSGIGMLVSTTNTRQPGGHLEYIKTRPTFFTNGSNSNTVKCLSAINSGSSMNVCSLFENSTGANSFPSNVNGFSDYRILGVAGNSGSLVVVKKGGSLPRLKVFQERDLSNPTAIWSTVFGKTSERAALPPAIKDVTKTAKPQRPQQPLPLYASATDHHHRHPPSSRPYVEGTENPGLEADTNMPSAMMTSIPPEGTLAGLLPPHPHNSTHHLPQPPPAHLHHHHHTGKQSQHLHQYQQHSSQVPYTRQDFPGGGSGVLGIPVSSGTHLQGGFARETWTRLSQGPYAADISSVNGHLLNGHVSNGHVPNGHVPNGHVPNGHVPNGHVSNGQLHSGPSHDATNMGSHQQPSNGMPNGHHSNMGGQHNHGYQHVPETVTSLNGYNSAQHGGGANTRMSYHLMNGQNTHAISEVIPLNSVPKILPKTFGSGNNQGNSSTFNGVLAHRSNGHSPMSTSSIPADEVNNANERQEEQRKDDRWGSFKKGIKYTHLKGIISGKFGKSENKENPYKTPTTQNRTVSSQGVNTQAGNSFPSRDGSPNKTDKNAGPNFQHPQHAVGRPPTTINGNSNGGTIPFSSPIETNLSTASAMQQHDSPAKQVPNGFTYGAPLRSSVVHFDIPTSTAMQQRGGSTRVSQTAGDSSDGLANRRSGSYQLLTHQQQYQLQHQQQGQPHQQQLSQQQLWRQEQHHYSADNLTAVLPSDHTYGTDGRTVPSSGCPEGSSPSDSGRGTAGGGGGGRRSGHNTSLDSGASRQQGHSSGNDSEWVDIPEAEIPTKQPSAGDYGYQTRPCHSQPQTKCHVPSNAPVMGTANLGLLRGAGASNSRRSLGRRESLVGTPPLPPLSPEASPRLSPSTLHTSRSAPLPTNGNQYQRSLSSSALNQPDLIEATDGGKGRPGDSSGAQPHRVPPDGGQRMRSDPRHQADNHRDRISLPPLISRHSTGRLDMAPSELTDALDLDSVLGGGGETEATSDDADYDEEEDRSTACDPDVNLIRKQLEGLEGMYSEVLKLLGSNSGRGGRMFPRHRLHGSLSSLPSSVVSATRPRDRRRGPTEGGALRKGSARDGGKGIQRRFQRLESHVVTLARSVAHLSSEMRSQTAIFQEMESIRNDVAALRSGTGIGGIGPLPHNPITTNPIRNGAIKTNGGSGPWDVFRSGGPGLNNPDRVKKLTQFFGDEPPLVRLFLKKLGYEKYANIFEQEKIGMLELPYITEDRLQGLGLPLGPRLRILQEAQGPITTDGNLSVYVV